MARRERLVIVDDDRAARELTGDYLRREGFDVWEAATMAAALAGAPRWAADCWLLDVRLPDGDGFDLARSLRAGPAPDAGIIFVTCRDDTMDRVIGLELGGDDYVPKPVALRELLARVRSVLRRRRPAVPVDLSVHTFDDWTIDLTRRELMDPAGAPVRLTRGEFDLLAALVRSAGRPVARYYLVEVVSNRDPDVGERTVDTLISRLRRKLEANPRSPRLIVTVQGVGYKLAAQVRSG